MSASQLQNDLSADARQHISGEPPLVVDLDGTLLRTDLLIESANAHIGRAPWRVFQLVQWLGGGRSNLKARLAKKTSLEVEGLPYNDELINWLRSEKAAGRVLILATASNRLLAERVAQHVDLFDVVYASDSKVNLKSQRKHDLLVEKFGNGGFDYIGNAPDDLAVWAAARKCYVAGGSKTLLAAVAATGKHVETVGSGRVSALSSFVKSLRPYQWTKNLLLFLPLAAAHIYGSSAAVAGGLLAFFAFSAAASAVYILNDLIDLPDDRQHPRKRHRPFAAGAISLLVGWLTWPALLAMAFVVSITCLPKSFLVTMTLYVLMTFIYSFKIKRISVLDVLMLAALYTLRVIAGAAAVSVSLSFWLLSFSMFLFLSLAFVKRFSELKTAREAGRGMQLRGRGYHPADLEMVAMLGSAAGYMAVLVLALYIQDPRTAELYGAPKMIWLACPLLLYWISRAWLIAHRGLMHDDPIVFALKDRVSWAIGGVMVVIFALARFIRWG